MERIAKDYKNGGVALEWHCLLGSSDPMLIVCCHFEDSEAERPVTCDGFRDLEISCLNKQIYTK